MTYIFVFVTLISKQYFSDEIAQYYTNAAYSPLPTLVYANFIDSWLS